MNISFEELNLSSASGGFNTSATSESLKEKLELIKEKYNLSSEKYFNLLLNNEAIKKIILIL